MSWQSTFFNLTFWLTPFGLYGLWKFMAWWWRVLAQEDSDVYGGRYDAFVFLPTMAALLWIPATFDVLSGQWPWDMAPLYGMLSLLGPLSFLAGFARFFHIHRTRLGRWLGVKAPSESN